MLKRWFFIIVLLIGIGCEQQPPLETVRVGVLPDQSQEIIKQTYQPLLHYLHQNTGLKYRLVIPPSYDSLLKLFAQNKLDLALFGGVTFVQAMHQSDAKALVMRNIDIEFNSIIIVSKHHQASNLDELAGEHFAFGPKLSTSGHLMPRFFLHNQQFIPESRFKKIHFSPSHDTTIQWVAAGKVDGGAVNRQIFVKMLKDNRIDKDAVKVIWQSPGYANYVWAVQAKLQPSQAQLIKDAFLALGQTPKDRPILSALGAKYFIPARADDFQQLQRAVNQYHVKGGQ